MNIGRSCSFCGARVGRFDAWGLPCIVDLAPIPARLGDDLIPYDGLWEWQGHSRGWNYSPIRQGRFAIYRTHECASASPPLKETAMSQDVVDLFAGQDKAPALSFKNAPVGTQFSGTVTAAPAKVQGIDFETGNKATWPDGNIQWSIVIGLDVAGEARSLWATVPSAMFAACQEAQKVAGALISVGGTLTVIYTGDKPNEKNPRLNPAKQYRVIYTPPRADNVFSTGGPAGSGSTAPVNGQSYPADPPF